MIDKEQEIFMNRADVFRGGTLINITLICDKSYYRLASEAGEELIFERRRESNETECL